MFAGIVEAVGQVVRVAPAARQAAGGTSAQHLEVRLGGLLDDLELGASVAINGVCLTLAARRGPVGGFDVVPQTWRSTTLRLLKIGDEVNVERSLRIGDRLDGHFVQGHVDGVGTVERLERGADEWKLWVTVDAALMPCIVRQGSIALDGTSLTVVDIAERSFSVALIPTTLERTVLARRQPGDPINVETDILARLVLSRLAALGLSGEAGAERTAEITLESLRESGFA